MHFFLRTFLGNRNTVGIRLPRREALLAGHFSLKVLVTTLGLFSPDGILGFSLGDLLPRSFAREVFQVVLSRERLRRFVSLPSSPRLLV